MPTMMENLAEVKALLSSPQDILITSHRNPDGDSIGSSLALYRYLVKLGHTVGIAFPSDYPELFGWMQNIERVVIDDSSPELVDKYIKRASIIFCLDYNALDRIDRMGEKIAARNCLKIMIDHHLNPDDFADYTLSDVSASSTCELIYDFITMLGDHQLIDVFIGECLFAGILTDTGSFRYSTSPKLFRTVADLLEIGVDDYKLQDLIFNSLSVKNLRLLGFCLNRRMEILEEYKTGIITLNKADYERFDIQRGDTEGIVNYLLKLRNVKMAAFITEQPTIVKISLRSKGNFSVQEIAQKHFKGGGHRNAAGGYSYQTLRGTVLRFKELLPLYRDQLVGEEIER